MTTDWATAIGMPHDYKTQLEAEILKNTAYSSIEDDTPEDVNLNTAETAAIAEQSLDMLAGLAMPTVYKYAFPIFYLAIWQLLKEKVAIPREFFQLALGVPRGFAKTTFVKIFVLYCILFTKKRFILILAETSEKAEAILSDVKDMLDETNIKTIFGDWKFALTTDRNNLKTFVFRGRPIVIAALGRDGSVRGLNLKNARPDIIIFDDIQSRKDADSETVSSAIEKDMIGTHMKAKSPGGCLFIYLANMYPTPHSILKKLKSNPTWTKIIAGGILADGTSLWEDLRSLDSLIQEFDNDIAAGHAEIFCSEVLNDTDSGINTRTDLTQIRAWPWPPDDLPQGKFILIDPSSNKTGGDDVAIGYFEVYDGTPALKQVIEEKLSPGNTIRRSLILALETGTRCIVAESTGYQSTLLYWFQNVAEQIGLEGFHFLEVHTGSVSKNSRITEMLKALTAGEIIIHSQVKSKVMYQIANWSPLRRNNIDNMLDLLAYCTKILELYGPMIMSDTNIEVIDGETIGVLEDNHAF